MANPQHGTLVASTVATVTLDADYNFVEVMNVTGVTAIYALIDSGVTNPTVAGAGCDVIPAVAGATRRFHADSQTSPTVVKLISSGTPGYSVKGGA